MEDKQLYKTIKEEFQHENPGQVVHDVRYDDHRKQILILHKAKNEHSLKVSTLSSSKAAAWARDKRLKRLGI